MIPVWRACSRAVSTPRRRRAAADQGRCGRSAGQSGTAGDEGHMAERPLVGEPQVGPGVGECEARPDVRADRPAWSPTRNWPLMPRCASSASSRPISTGTCPPPRRGDHAPGHRASKSAGPARWRRTAAGAGPAASATLRPDHVPLQTAPHGLDLGKLGHQSRRACWAPAPRWDGGESAAPGSSNSAPGAPRSGAAERGGCRARRGSPGEAGAGPAADGHLRRRRALQRSLDQAERTRPRRGSSGRGRAGAAGCDPAPRGGGPPR